MYILYVYTLCIYFMYIMYVYNVCIYFMYILYVYTLCIYFTYILYVYTLCIYFMHILYAYMRELIGIYFMKTFIINIPQHLVKYKISSIARIIWSTTYVRTRWWVITPQEVVGWDLSAKSRPSSTTNAG